MIKVAPFADELAHAHERRYMGFRGFRVVNDAYRRAFAREREIRFPTAPGVPRLHLLASFGADDPGEYVAQHSMLPIRRVVAQGDDDGSFASEEMRKVVAKKGLLIPKRDVCLCFDCVEEVDKNRERPTYLRRHHFLGGNWCPKHGGVLQRVLAEDPLSRAPCWWREKGQTEPLRAEIANLGSNPWLTRYTAISISLLSRPRPASAYLLQRALSGRMRTQYAKVPLVSDLLLRMVPREWADTNIEGFSAKRQGAPFSKIDSLIAQCRTAWPGSSYAMVLATLYEDVEEAVRTVDRCNRLSGDSTIPPKPSRSSTTKYWHGEAWMAYLDSGGSHKVLANRLGETEKNVAFWMKKLGLPGLQKNGQHRLWNALVRYGDGQSIADSAKAEGIPREELESILRTCAARAVHAARHAGFGPKDKDDPERS